MWGVDVGVVDVGVVDVGGVYVGGGCGCVDVEVQVCV